MLSGSFECGKMRGVPARWGDPARGIPTLLDPAHAEEHHEPGPPPLFEPGPPSGRPPPAPLWEGARGKGSRLEKGSRLVAFSSCGRFGRGNTTSRVPPTSRDPLPLLRVCLGFVARSEIDWCTSVCVFVSCYVLGGWSHWW